MPNMKTDTDTPIPQKSEEVTRDRALRLFKYLQEFVRMRSKSVYSIDQYEEVHWFSEIPQEAGCYCAAWLEKSRASQSETWIEVNRPKLKNPPKPPEDLAPWLNPREICDSSLDMPQILERIPFGRWGKPDELAGLCVFLASDACPYMHGSVVVADGGWLAR